MDFIFAFQITPNGESEVDCCRNYQKIHSRLFDFFSDKQIKHECIHANNNLLIHGGPADASILSDRIKKINREHSFEGYITYVISTPQDKTIFARSGLGLEEILNRVEKFHK